MAGGGLGMMELNRQRSLRQSKINPEDEAGHGRTFRWSRRGEAVEAERSGRV